MVYRGRPSTGCKKCRERKIKCDERPEGCTKCMTAGFVCPGYDRSSDKLFHDETASVVVKAKKSKAKAIAARDAQAKSTALVISRSASPSSSSASPSSSAQSVVTYPTPGLVPLIPLVDHGISYFMSRFSIGMDEPSVQSEDYYRYIATDGFHPLVATSMTALGLAGVANIYSDPALKQKATRWYLDAINMTNKAISSPSQVKSDTTLLAITLLGMFEATFNEYSFMEWSNHINGAAALIKIRGAQQFSTTAGRRMYLHTIGSLALNCLGAGKPMPAYVDELNQDILQYLDTSDPRERFFFLNNRIIDFRAEIIRDPSIPLQEIITRALELDATAACMFDSAGPEWAYEKIPCVEDSPLVFGDSYHVYPSLSAAQTYNWWRYSRIYLHDIIRNAELAALSASPPAVNEFDAALQLSISNATLQDMQSGILASMPQFLHDVSSITSHNTTRTPSPSPTQHKDIAGNFPGEAIPFRRPQLGAPTTDRLPIMRVSGGHSTIWAVYIAGSMPTATGAAQEFALKCLGRFQSEFGINQGKVLAGSLEEIRKKGRRVEGVCPAYLPD